MKNDNIINVIYLYINQYENSSRSDLADSVIIFYKFRCYIDSDFYLHVLYLALNSIYIVLFAPNHRLHLKINFRNLQYKVTKSLIKFHTLLILAEYIFLREEITLNNSV